MKLLGGAAHPEDRPGDLRYTDEEMARLRPSASAG
jgi:hypothetical protein